MWLEFPQCASSLRFEFTGQGCNVLDGECAPRAPCAVALALGLIDRAALRCSIIYYQNMAAWCGTRSTTSIGTPRKQLSECSAGNGSLLYLPGARTRRTLACLARSLQKMPQCARFRGNFSFHARGDRRRYSTRTPRVNFSMSAHELQFFL